MATISDKQNTEIGILLIMSLERQSDELFSAALKQKQLMICSDYSVSHGTSLFEYDAINRQRGTG
jgi:hypothetical protein